MTKGNMIRYYRKFSAAERYILGFVENHIVYMVEVDEIMPRFLTVEQASRNQGENLRLRIRKAHKAELMKHNAIALGKDTDLVDSIGHLNNKGKMAYWNKGEMFEKMVTEYFGQIWEKDTVGFWVQGDINLNGVEVQIKLADATLMDTNKMHKLQKSFR